MDLRYPNGFAVRKPQSMNKGEIDKLNAVKPQVVKRAAVVKPKPADITAQDVSKD